MAKSPTQNLIIVRGRGKGSSVQFNDNAPDFCAAFNPTEYSIDKKTNYSEAAVPGLDTPILQFSRGDSEILTLEVLLDTYADDQSDVRKKYLDTLESFARVDGDLHAAPPCKIVWGTTIFVGVLESLSNKFVLFLPGGIPVRARVNMSWKEYVPLEMQVKKTRRSSADRHKSRRITEGDTLWQLAYEAYGDPQKWKLLAEKNNIDNPRKLEAGQVLDIPPLPLRRA